MLYACSFAGLAVIGLAAAGFAGAKVLSNTCL
jgi:hypothetical protein